MAVNFSSSLYASKEEEVACTWDSSEATAWDYRGFSNDANYYNAFDTTGWDPTTYVSASTIDAGSSKKFGYFQMGADNCMWGNGLRETWIFPSLGTYQACYRSGSGTAGRRIYMDGSAPAAGETDQRTYITVSLTQPPVDLSPAASSSMMFAALCVILAMLL